MAFFIPHRLPHVRRVIVVTVTVSVTVAGARAFPDEFIHLAHGFKEGVMTLLIEHVLHNWGVIFTGAVSMVIHTIHGGD